MNHTFAVIHLYNEFLLISIEFEYSFHAVFNTYDIDIFLEQRLVDGFKFHIGSILQQQSLRWEVHRLNPTI